MAYNRQVFASKGSGREKNTQNWDKAQGFELLTSALLVCVLWGVASLSYAGPESLNTPGSGSFMVSSPQGGYRELARQNTDFSLTVNGMVVQAVVTQAFVNDSDQWIEGRYVFPLPSQSAVNDMTMHVGERVIKGQIKEKRTARKVFLKARQQGKKASLVEQQRSNLFTNSVTNIAPGERIEVELRYLQTLRYDNGEFSLRIPMTLTPRYIPGKKISGIRGQGWAFNTDQVPDASQITPPQRTASKSMNQATVSVHLTPGFELAAVESSYHDIVTVESTQENLSSMGERYSISTKSPSVAMDRDFVLRWRPVTSQAPVAAFFNQSLENQQGVDDHHGLLMVMPPQQSFVQQPSPRELILVIDTSGSMAGTSIEQAKQALQLALQRLTPRDSFNVIEFNSNTHRLFARSVVASDGNITVAKRYVDGLRANGGTEIRAALEAALVQSSGSEFAHPGVRQVVFITDGSVGNEEALFGYIEKHIGESRLFTVAIGSAPNSYFMKKAAQFGRGVYTSIGNVREVQRSMTALFETIERPLLTDINVTFHNGGKTEFYPAKISDLYAEEPLLLQVKLAEQTDTVTVSGEYQGRYWQQDIVPNWSQEHVGVATLWARQKIEHLMDESVRQGNRDQFRDEIVDLGTHYKIMSRYTSFVAVDQTPARSEYDTLALRKIANSMPAGSAQVAPSVAYPTTALGINGLVLSGGLSVFFALLALCLKQDRHILRIKYAIGQESKP